MIIQTHWLYGTAQGLKQRDLEYIADLCRIPLSMFSKHVWDTGAAIYKYAVPGSGSSESVIISIPAKDSAYTKITFKGSWFDHYPEFPIHALHQFFKDHGGNTLKIDLSFIDNEDHLFMDEYKHMSSKENYLDYLQGSCLNSRRKADCDSPKGLPDIRQNHPVIYFGNIKSNYVKMYKKEGKHAKFELTLQDKAQIKTILDSYRPEAIEQFEQLSKQALVKHLNFVRPSSRKSRKPIQIDSYRKFLGSEVKAICWADHQPLADIVAESFDSALSRVTAALQNLAKRHGIFELLNHEIWQLNKKMSEAFYINQETA